MKQFFMSRKGFHLVELLVTIAIVGTVAGFASVRYIKARCKADTEKQLAVLQAMKNQIDTCIFLTHRVPNLCNSSGKTYDCSKLIMGKIQGCGPIDCFEQTNQDFQNMMIDGEVCYTGGEDGNKGSGNDPDGCDGDNPGNKDCLDIPGYYDLQYAKESCFTGLIIYADASEKPARLVPIDKVPPIIP
jgi:prepilin-type N-terminal cleavage/methylation domain-containing protein